MPEERWEHSGKWLFPARLHIGMGNGRKKSVFVHGFLFMCVCVSASLDQLGISYELLWSTVVRNNSLIVFKYNLNQAHTVHGKRFHPVAFK